MAMNYFMFVAVVILCFSIICTPYLFLFILKMSEINIQMNFHSTKCSAQWSMSSKHGWLEWAGGKQPEGFANADILQTSLQKYNFANLLSNITYVFFKQLLSLF